MSLFGKSVEQLTEANLQWLVEQQVMEGNRLDYKRDMYGGGEDDRREMLRDVTAIANHRGGIILIGVDEDASGAASEILGVPTGKQADWIQSVCLTGIEERIVGLRVHEILLTNGNQVLAIDIPESLSTPQFYGEWLRGRGSGGRSARGIASASLR